MYRLARLFFNLFYNISTALIESLTIYSFTPNKNMSGVEILTEEPSGLFPPTYVSRWRRLGQWVRWPVVLVLTVFFFFIRAIFSDRFTTATSKLFGILCSLPREWKYNRLDEWKMEMRGWWKRWEATIVWTFIKSLLTLLSMLVVLLVANTLFVGYGVSMWGTQHYLLSAESMRLANYRHVKDVPHVVSCPCDHVRLVDLQKGMIESKGVYYPVHTVLRSQEEVIRAGSVFSMPKLWTSDNRDDFVFLAQNEFNPCLLSIVDTQGLVKHIFNPVVLKSVSEKVQWTQSTRAFPFAPPVAFEANSRFTVRGVSPEHGGTVEEYAFDGKYAKMVYFAVEMLEGRWYARMTEQMREVERQEEERLRVKKEQEDRLKEKKKLENADSVKKMGVVQEVDVQNERVQYVYETPSTRAEL